MENFLHLNLWDGAAEEKEEGVWYSSNLISWPNFNCFKCLLTCNKQISLEFCLFKPIIIYKHSWNNDKIVRFSFGSVSELIKIFYAK